MQYFKQSHLNGLAIIFLGFFLTACGGGGSSESEQDAGAADIVTTLSGSIGDGPITGATIRIKDKDGNILLIKEDNSSSFVISLKSPGKSYPITIEAYGGIDLVSNAAPDFILISVVHTPGEKNQANINPYSTLIVKTAIALGGINKGNVATATDYVLDAFNFGLDASLVPDPIRTSIDINNIAVMVKASEAFGEMIRRTVSAMQRAGYNTTAEDVVSALALDIVDGVIDGVGATGVDTRISAMSKAVSAQVLLESLTNDLMVNGVDATAAMDNAILVVNPNVPASLLTDSVLITSAMITQARLSVEAANTIVAGSVLDSVSNSLDALMANSLPGDITAFDSSVLDSVITTLGTADNAQLMLVNSTISISINSTPTISGTPDTSVNGGSAYSFTPIAADADGDMLIFSITNKPVWATFDTSTGTLAGNPDGGNAGLYSNIVISVSDGKSTASLDSFAITVVNINGAPSISGTPVNSVFEGSAYTFTPVASDPDGDSLTFSITNKPVWANFNNANGTLSGVPGAGNVGLYNNIVISVSDGNTISSLAAFSITVRQTNSAPTISGTPATSVAEGSNYSFIPTAVDSDGDSLSFSIINKPAWASFNTGNGALTGIPGNSSAGVYSNISISVSDGSSAASLGTFNITVTDSNRAPVANAGADLVVATGATVNLSGSGSDADGDALTYQWAVSSQPNGSAVVLSGANSAAASFTADVDGDYVFSLTVNDGTVNSVADSVTITSETTIPPVIPPTVPPTSGGGFAPLTVEITDNFNNGVVANSDIHKGLWSLIKDSNVSISEATSKLSIVSTGTNSEMGRLQSGVDYRYNFFTQPLRFSLKGLGFNGNAANADKQLMLVLSTTKETPWLTPDALVLKVGGDGRVSMGWKVDAPGADAEIKNSLFNQILSQVPTEVQLTLDQTSYELTAIWAGGSKTFNGAHNIPVAQWGDRGDAALSITGRRTATSANGTNATINIDALEVVSLKFFDGFNNTLVADTGHRNAFWQATGSAVLTEQAGELRLTGEGSNGYPSSGVVSPISKDLSFFTQKLKYQGKVILSGSVSNPAQNIARFGLGATRESVWQTPSAMVLAISADKRVRLGWKTKSPAVAAELTNVLLNQIVAQVPTSFELALDKKNYQLKLYWNGGSQTFNGVHNILWYNWSGTGQVSLSLESQRNSTVVADTAIASWQHVKVLRNQAHYIGPTVLAPITDGFNLGTAGLDDKQDLAKWGMVDVTKAPFNADPTGIKDSTQGIQHAVDFARERQMVAFFPPGTYKVSDTITCTQGRYVRSNGQELHWRQAPCAMIGSRAGTSRPKIYLAPNSAGFTDPVKHKYVVHFWARQFQGDPNIENSNVSMNQVFINIDIEVGTGNSGAIGIHHEAAQGSAMEEVTIDVTNGYAGVEGGMGAGGSHADITVIGGEFGLRFTDTEHAPTITGITLIGQRKHAILYNGMQTLTAVGMKIVVPTGVTGPAIKNPVMTGGWSAVYGQMSIIDAEIEFQGANSNNVAISTGRSIYLKNVYAKNANKVVAAADGTNLFGNNTGWQKVNEHAHGVRPPVYNKNGSNYQYEAPVYQDGARSFNTVQKLGGQGIAPPADLMSRHLWNGNFPGFGSATAVNVMEAPYNAKGDGVTDDTDAIQNAINANEVVFIPKGYFKTSRPLDLKSNTKLIGLARHLSVIIPRSGTAFNNAAAPQPVVRSPNDANATTVVAFVSLHAPVDLPGVYSLNWRSGRNSVVRDINVDRWSAYGFTWSPGKGQQYTSEFPLVKVSNNGGGKWYNFYRDSMFSMNAQYRHMLVDGTSQQMNCYQCNFEYAATDAQFEIRNSSNVAIYGLKGEGNHVVMWVRDSNNINVFGYGGNGTAFASTYTYKAGFQQYTPSLFRIERTSNLRLVNVVDHGRISSGGGGFVGAGTDPNLWHMIVDIDGAGNARNSNFLDRPVLYIRGNPQ